MWRETHGRVLQNLDNRGVFRKTPLGEGAGMFRSSELRAKGIVKLKKALHDCLKLACNVQGRFSALRGGA